MPHPYHPPPKGAYTTTIPFGVKAFRKVAAEVFGFTRTEVVRDRSRCANQASTHCTCRGIDFFGTHAQMQALFDACVTHGHELNIQAVIYNLRCIGFGRWDEGPRPYTGTHPHDDHVHVEFNNIGAADLTETQVRRLLTTQEDQMTPEQARQLEAVFKVIAEVHPHLNNTFAFVYDVHPRIKKTEAGVATLQTGAIDYDRLATEVAERLGPQIAKAVADELWRRGKE